MVTLKQMEALYWVGILGSFSAAAEKLNIAQSTISKRIQELEDTLRIQLFDRDKRAGRLTMKGAEVVPIAEEMLRLQKKLRDVTGSQETYSGTFRVGITELVAMTWLPRLLARVRKTYPVLTVEPRVDVLAKLITSLKDRHLDLVIGPRVPDEELLASLHLATVEQAWVCSPSMYQGPTTLPLKRLAEFTLLTQPSGSGLQSLILRLLRENGVQAKNTISCNGMTALAKLAEGGLGITCIPRFYFMPEVRAGRLKVLKTIPALPGLPFAATYIRDSINDLSASIAHMAAEVCDFDGQANRVLPSNDGELPEPPRTKRDSSKR